MKIHPKGFDLSLDRIASLLHRLGNPQHRIPPAIHVAGTNGKGSTIAMCRAILEASGKSVHVHTSPHLVNWNERYRLGTAEGSGRLVDDDTLADAIELVAQANGGQAITVFEILSAVMFVLFAEHPADYSLVEVGLGGRFDATNVITQPIVSVIAPVSLDHEAYLGDTLEKIAFEKAGIIKRNQPVAIGIQDSAALETIVEVAERNHCTIAIAGQDFESYEQAGRFVYNDEEGLLDLPLPALVGDHQITNAGLAIAAIRLAGIPVRHDQFATAMRNVVWPGRMERLQSGKLTAQLPKAWSLWIDGGHNPSAGGAIAAHLRHIQQRSHMPVTLISAMLTTKAAFGYFKPFAGIVDEVLTVPIPASEAGFAPDVLAKEAMNAGLAARSFDTIEEALMQLARDTNAEPRMVVFCGSLYHVGNVLAQNGTPPK